MLPERSNPARLQYSAFISYSHSDAKFARRLHRRLETYQLPHRLAGRGLRGDQSRRLRPVFLDRAVMPAAPSLTEYVREAIASSEWLIVICSPHSKRSEWVEREIALFRQLHGGDAILAALIEGKAPDAFPPGLRQIGPDARAAEPLAADFQRARDGWRLAFLKLFAVLADVTLDDLVQRDAQRELARRTTMSVIGFVVAAMLAVAALVALSALTRLEREQRRGADLIGHMLTDLRGKIKIVGRLDLLEALDDVITTYFRGLDPDQLPLATLIERSRLDLAIGEDEIESGLLTQARSAIDDALKTTTALMRGHEHDGDCILAHAQSAYWEGFIDWQTGNVGGAQFYWAEYASLAQRLIGIDASRPDWLIEVAYSNSNLGSLALREFIDVPRARQYLKRALVAAQGVERRKPDDVAIQSELANDYSWLGDVERVAKHLDAAMAYRMEQREILNRLLQHDLMDAQTQTNLTYNRLGVARIYLAQGALADALRELAIGRASAAERVRNDRTDSDLASQVRIFDLFTAKVWIVTPHPAQPPAATILALLGDCAAAPGAAGAEELSLFCHVLQARWLAEQGRFDEAARSIQPWEPRLRAYYGRLTPGWGLDFAEEIREIPHAPDGPKEVK